MKPKWRLQKSFAKVVLPEELADTTIVVLGLLEMGYDDPAIITELLGQERQSVRALLRKLKRSRNATVRRCMDVGLPPGVCRPFPREGVKVRCPVCKNMVNQAPCPSCSLSFSRAIPSPALTPRPLPKRATKARPGTRKKIRAMRRRAAKGLSLFHPRDAQFCE